MTRERKHDFNGAVSELRGILAREVRERWTHARFLEEYARFCASERTRRLSRASYAWVCGMVSGAHASVDAMCRLRWFVGGAWRDRDWMNSQPLGAAWPRVERSRFEWPTGEERSPIQEGP